MTKPRKFRVFNTCHCSQSSFSITNEVEMSNYQKIDCGIYQYYREEPCFVCGCILYFSRPYSQAEIEELGTRSIFREMRENYVSIVEAQQT